MLRLCREELFFFGLDNVNGLRSHTVLTYPPAEVTAGLPCPWVYDKIPSLTVDERKNLCIPCVYWDTEIFAVVSNYSNLFLPLTFFLDCSHFAFGYELIVCPETAGFMKSIRDTFPTIQGMNPCSCIPAKFIAFRVSSNSSQVYFKSSFFSR